MTEHIDSANKFKQLCEIIAKLRDPISGCPWDIKQTHTSLKPYLIEEAYELLEAIEDKPDQIKHELGDVLLQIMLHAQIASDEKRFTIAEVLDLLNLKLVERHPHVFGDKTVKSAEEVASNWTKSKQQKNSAASILGDLASALPALHKARLLGSRAATVGFDWSGPEPVIAKVDEELEELKAAVKSGSQSALEEELGDLLFAIAQLARKYKSEPEELLQKACKKFVSRFMKMEALAGEHMSQLSADELDLLWQKAKK